MISKELLDKYYPRDQFDGTVIFYDWVRSFAKKNFVVLNLGAGSTSERKIKSLKNEVKTVFGADIDEAVINNTDLEHKFVIENNKLLFNDNFFDLIWSDFVLEHVKDPDLFLEEVYRTLKPNCSFFFRTPNKFHYVSIISKMTPHWFHKLVVKLVQEKDENAHEPHLTYYKLNTENEIIKLSKKVGFKKTELRFIETEPSYLLFNVCPFILGLAYERIVNKFKQLYWLRANIFGCLTK